MGSDLQAALVDAMREDDGVVAIWLDGSIGRGVADEYSDLDLGVAVDDDRIDDFLAALPDIVRAACDPVLLRPMGRLLTLVTDAWDRADIFTRTRTEMASGILGPVKVLHDPDDCIQVTLEPPAPAEGRLSDVIAEFLRCLGLLPIVAARNEWIGAYIATGMMTGLLTEVMQIENGSSRVGGALRLNARLTDQQRGVLQALPQLRPEREAVIDTHTALAQAFLPRARRVAQAAGVPYPERLETAVRRHLSHAGIRLGDL